MFRLSSYPVGLFRVFYNLIESDILKMASFKPEAPISQFVDKNDIQLMNIIKFVLPGSRVQGVWDFMNKRR